MCILSFPYCKLHTRQARNLKTQRAFENYSVKMFHKTFHQLKGLSPQSTNPQLNRATWPLVQLPSIQLRSEIIISLVVYEVNREQFASICQIMEIVEIKQYFNRSEMYLRRGHPHSTHAHKLSKLDPPSSLCAIVCIWLDPPLYVRTFYIFTPPLLINFYSDSSFRHSQFLGYFHFYQSLEV